MLFDSAMTMLCRCEDTHDGNACSVDGTYKSDKEYECPTLGLRFATAFVICYESSKESQCQLSFRSCQQCTLVSGFGVICNDIDRLEQLATFVRHPEKLAELRQRNGINLREKLGQQTSLEKSWWSFLHRTTFDSDGQAIVAALDAEVTRQPDQHTIPQRRQADAMPDVSSKRHCKETPTQTEKTGVEPNSHSRTDTAVSPFTNRDADTSGLADCHRSEGVHVASSSSSANQSRATQDDFQDKHRVHPYYEIQVDAWCGMHSLNNFLGGPYVTQDDCRRACSQVVTALSEAAGGRRESSTQHLHPQSGWLSIDVINVLGTGLLGLHVEADSVSFDSLALQNGADVFVNCNNQHWTVLTRHPNCRSWVHVNSIYEGDRRFHGRTETTHLEEVAQILADIHDHYGGYSLHRVTRHASTAGEHFLEAAGQQAMLPREEDVLPDNVSADAGVVDIGDPQQAYSPEEISLVTINVDGLLEVDIWKLIFNHTVSCKYSSGMCICSVCNVMYTCGDSDLLLYV